jgi:DNA primase
VRREGKDGFAKALAEAKPLSQFLFAELASRVDMANEEGRARFLAEARPLVAQIEAPALAVMLRRRMGELARLSPEEIEQLVPSKVPPKRPSAAPARTVRKATQSLQQRLLVLVAATPEVAAEVPQEVLAGGGADWAALREVIAFFREDGRRNLGQASAYFEGSDVSALLRVALEDPLFEEASSPDFNVKAEVSDLVERLREALRSRRSDELLKLLVAGTATEDEKAEYREIAAHQATAKSGNPSPEERSKL